MPKKRTKLDTVMKKFTVNEHEEKAIYHQALSSNAEKVNS